MVYYMGLIDDLKDKVKSEVNEVAVDLKSRKGTFDGLYIYGHPNVKGHNIGVWLILYEGELVVKQKSKGILLFNLPYEKMESANVLDAKKTSASGLIPSAMKLFDGNKIKGDVLEIVAIGKDKNNNQVRVPILFGDIRSCLKLKTVLDSEIAKSQGVTI